MSVGGFDVELNGVKYNLAEDAQGDHYLDEGTPLRPPNAVTVQGEGSRQVFQMRPDVVKWTLTDWSGGAGQQKFNPDQPNLWRKLDQVRPFDVPGKLSAGWAVSEMQDSGGVLAVDGPLVVKAGVLYMLDDGGANLYTWSPSTEQWSVTALTGPAGGASRQADSDANNVYWHEDGTDNVWKWTSGGTATQIDSAGMGNFSDALLAELGAFVYVYSPSAGEVWEISKAGSSETKIDDFANAPSAAIEGNQGIVAMDGKLYILTTDGQVTTIREITPTTAAGTGFGAEIGRWQGFVGQALWQHSGTLYMFGKYGNTDEATVLYVDPEGNYGTLGRIEVASYDVIGSASPLNGRMLTHYFGAWDGTNYLLHEVDAVTGGQAVIAKLANASAVAQATVLGNEGVFFTTDIGASERSYWADPLEYASSCYAISPWHDFNLSDVKVLSSLVLSMEDLPADWRVRVDYAINGDDTWTNVIDNTTTGSNGERVAVSTDTSTIKFRTLSIRIRLDYTGGGIPTTTPVILGVDANAMVARKVQGFRLLLDLDNDQGRVPGLSGYRKAENIRAAAATEGVISYKDGYESQTPGKYTEYDMVIDQYRINLSQAGQGTAEVLLLEPV